jgi:hypothetical protein
MFKFCKTLLIFASTVGFALICYSFYDRQFKLSNITGNFPVVEAKPISHANEAYLKNIFSQPFHYLDRGKQSYVFESQDKLYVLKVFDNRCLRSGKLPFLFTIEKERCAKKIKQLFDGFKVAEALGTESTGLLFLQLAPDPSYTLHVHVKDRFVFIHDIDLSNIPFALQQKAIPMRIVISDLLNKGKLKEAEQRLHQVIHMYVEGYKKGVIDLDHNFMYNTGFIDNHPIRIDVGRLKYEEQASNPKYFIIDLQKVFIDRLGKWLERHFPQQRQSILDEIQIYLMSIANYEFSSIN